MYEGLFRLDAPTSNRRHRHNCIKRITQHVHGECSGWLTLAVNTRTVLAIVPPQGCEAILVEILQSKQYCLLVKPPSGITDDKICNNALLHPNLARQRSINVRNSMIYLDLLYFYSLLRK